MGLKSGSRDAGLDDSDSETDEADSQRDNTEATTETPDEKEPATTTETETAASAETETGSNAEPEIETAAAESPTADRAADPSSEATGETDTETQRPTMDSIPYKLRRDKVNEGREQVPYFLREEIIDAEDELQATLEASLGEDVYKSDYREAAMVVAQRNPELVAEILREWGYDLNAT